MTRTTSSTNRLSRAVLGFVVLASMLLVAAPLEVSAGNRTKSDAIAAEAQRAIEAIERWDESKDPADYVLFVRSRQLTATMTAVELELDADLMEAEWADASSVKQRAVLAAMSQLGVPYRYAKSIEGVAFDCSGLMAFAYSKVGIELSRSSRPQIRNAAKIERSDAEPGDLVYYPGHIMMYLGVGAIVHSPNSGSHVEATRITTRRTLRFGDVTRSD